MFSLVEQQEQSSLSIAAFCAENNFKLATFHYWRKKYKLGKLPNRFIPIVAPDVEEQAIRLSYPNGVNIHLSSAHISLISHLIQLV
ncbi:MAG: helix-turn-helix domain-containing protein [Chitinophagaceae bacterium]|nr:MAG: helix-turn-helix domain-containing protein [Chitinophagaceae bacterium]